MPMRIIASKMITIPPIGVKTTLEVLEIWPPTKEPRVIPMLKAAILNAETRVISFGVNFSAS